eukprot:3805528-Pleurochrysis_carterae.AAC.2
MCNEFKFAWLIRWHTLCFLSCRAPTAVPAGSKKDHGGAGGVPCAHEHPRGAVEVSGGRAGRQGLSETGAWHAASGLSLLLRARCKAVHLAADGLCFWQSGIRYRCLACYCHLQNMMRVHVRLETKEVDEENEKQHSQEERHVAEVRKLQARCADLSTDKVLAEERARTSEDNYRNKLSEIQALKEGHNLEVVNAARQIEQKRREIDLLELKTQSLELDKVRRADFQST